MTSIREWLKARREARQVDRRERLAQDAHRARVYQTMVLIDARNLGAPIPHEVTAAVVL